jgi:flagellar motor switch protein FliG
MTATGGDVLVGELVTLEEMSGPRKAAVLLMSVGTEQAAAMLRRLPADEVHEILAEVAELEDVDPEVASQVIADFAEAAESSRGLVGGAEVARKLLEAAMGEEALAPRGARTGDAIVRRPFEFLHHVEPRLAATFLADEPARVIALVLANLPAELAADLLACFELDFRRDVAARIAVLGPTSAEVLGLIEEHLAARFATIIVEEPLSLGGVEALVEVLTRSDADTERAVVDGLREVDEALAEKVRAAMFSFDDLQRLSDREVQQVLRGVDSKDLAIALKGASEGVTEKILSNLSSRASETLREEIELLGRVRMAAVEEARATVMRVVAELQEAGQIVVERAGDDFVD